MASSDDLFLGLDLGTQSMRAVIINSKLLVVAHSIVTFDKEMPHYHTINGYHKLGTRFTAPALMWVEAVELALCALQAKEDCPSFSKIKSISFSAQQHGCVLWKYGAAAVLSSLSSEKSLVDQLSKVFSLAESPIWMDSSTREFCMRLEHDVGGARALAVCTGSRAYERFTGNQISFIIENNFSSYDQCERISLISSMLPSLFLGHYAPIDVGDGSGMNLLDIHKKVWNSDALKSVSGSVEASIVLQEKLGNSVVEGFSCLGFVSSFFIAKFGFAENCMIIAGSGDNNNSLVGLKTRIGDIVLSLGTSDTVLGTTKMPTPNIEGHIMCHPLLPDAYMSMVCYSNGSLTRQWARDQFSNGDWNSFEAAINATPVGNNGNIGIYFLDQEITPQYRQPGIYRFCKDGAFSVPEFSGPDKDAVNLRAIVEGQALSRRLHSERLGVSTVEGGRLIVCGGASANVSVVQILADVFGLDAYMDTEAGVQGAAVGAAIRAAHGAMMVGKPYSDAEKVYLNLLESAGLQKLEENETEKLKLICRAVPENHSFYTHMLGRYAALEDCIQLLEGVDDICSTPCGPSPTSSLTPASSGFASAFFE